MKKINLGIIGCGSIMRLMHLPVLKSITNKFTIVKIFDTDKSVYKKLNKYEGIAAKSSEEIFKHPAIDAVFILTPISSHYDYTIKALKYNKHVFLEKPAALTSIEIERMLTASKKNKNIVQVGMVLRYSKWFEKLDSIINSGKYGKVLWMNWLETRPFDPMNWRYDTKNNNGDAIIHDKAVHQVNLFNAFAGSKPERVMAMAGQYMINLKLKKLRTFRKEVMLNGDSNDHLICMIQYKNNVKANLFVSYVSPHARESRWVIQLEKAKVVTHFETFVKGKKSGRFQWGKNPSAIYLFKDDKTYNVPWRIPMSYPPDEKNLIFYDEYETDHMHPGSTKQLNEFYKCIVNNKKPSCSLEIALEDTRVIEAIDRSVRKLISVNV